MSISVVIDVYRGAIDLSLGDARGSAKCSLSPESARALGTHLRSAADDADAAVEDELEPGVPCFGSAPGGNPCGCDTAWKQWIVLDPFLTVDEHRVDECLYCDATWWPPIGAADGGEGEA